MHGRAGRGHSWECPPESRLGLTSSQQIKPRMRVPAPRTCSTEHVRTHVHSLPEECPAAPTQLGPGLHRPSGSVGAQGRLEAGSPKQRPCPPQLGPGQRRIREVRPQVSLADFSPFPARALWRGGSGSPYKQPRGRFPGCRGEERQPLWPLGGPQPRQQDQGQGPRLSWGRCSVRGGTSLRRSLGWCPSGTTDWWG